MSQLADKFKSILKSGATKSGMSMSDTSTYAERHLNMLMHNTEEAFVLVDLSCTIITFNEKFKTLYADYFHVDVQKGDSIIDYAQKHRVEIVKGIYQKVFAGEKITSEIEIPIPDQSVMTFAIYFKPAYDDTGKTMGAFVSIKDCTNEKKWKEQLLTNEKRFRTLVENSGDVTAIISTDGSITYISPTVKRLLGYTEEEALELGILQLMHSEDQESVQQVMMDALSKPAIPVYGPTIRIRHKNGHWCWFETTITNMQHDLSVNGLIYNFRDVTEKVLTEQQKEFYQRDKEALINNTEDMIWSIDSEFRLIAANKSFTNAVQKATGVLLTPGTKVLLSFYPAEFMRFWQGLYTRGLSGEIFIHEIFAPAPDKNNNRWSEVSFNPIYDAHQTIIGVACYGRNITEQKIATQNLIESEAKFRALIERVSDAFIAFDKNLCYTYVNKQAGELIRRDPESLIGQYVWDVFPEAVGSATYNSFVKAMETQEYVQSTDYYEPLDLWQENHLYPSADGLSVFIRDISASKRAEHKIKQTESNLRAIFEHASEGFFLLDKNGIIKTFNSKAQEYSVYNNVAPIETGKSIYDYADPDRKEYLKEIIEKVLNGETLQYDRSYPISDGTNVWFNVTFNPVFDHAEITGICITNKDITRRKNAADLVLKEKELSDYIINTLPGIFYLYDDKGKFLRWNKNFEKVSEYNAEEIAAMTPDLFFEGEDKAIIIERISKVFKEGIGDAEANFSTKSGKKIPYYFTGILLSYEGKPCLIGMGIDITQRKQSEKMLIDLNLELEKHAEELAISNADLEQFAYIASHDLQEPLRMVTSFLTQLQKKYQDQLDDKAQQYIHFATDGAVRMRRIILDLLEYSRVGRKEYESEQVDMNELMEEVVLLNRNDIQDKQAEIRWDNLPVIHGGKTPIQQVLQNLIGNALKYQKSGVIPVIHVSSSELPGYWQFAVSDNGIGIDPMFYEKIFVLFQRLHNKDEFSGTGIGLSICKKIIEHYKGKIWVDSVQGTGSTFYFTIRK